jgi:hypothetical protein
MRKLRNFAVAEISTGKSRLRAALSAKRKGAGFMTNHDKITVRFTGMDYWYRAVFTTLDGSRFYKSVELMSIPDFYNLDTEEKELILHTLHTTDEFEGEPGYPMNRERFELV